MHTILTFLLDLLNGIPRNLILPPANLFLVIVAGLLLWRRRPRLARMLAAGGLAALALLSTTGGARLFVAPLERQTAPLLASEIGPAPAVLLSRHCAS